jgi:putative transposase
MKKVSGPEVVRTVEASESPLPAEIQQALGEVVGPKGKHDADQTAKRHGHEDGSMTLGGRRAAVCGPRMRTADDEHELPVSTYGYFADRDPLRGAVMDRMLAGVSTRRFASVGEPVGEEVEQASSATGKFDGVRAVHRADPDRAR